MQTLAMVQRPPLDYLPPFGRVPKDRIATEARMSCSFDRNLDWAFLDALIEKHWPQFLADNPDEAPVLTLHFVWGEGQMAGLALSSVADGHDSLTDFEVKPGEEYPEDEPIYAVSKAFMTDVLLHIFGGWSYDYQSLIDLWRDKISGWVGHDYQGTASFFIPLRDRALVFIKDDDEYERIPAFVITDLDDSNHSLIKAYQRVAQVPSGIRSWCPKAALRDGCISLYRA